MDNTKVLEESILRVFDENGEEIKFTTKEIKYFIAKYNGTKKPSKCLFLDGVQLANNKKKLRKVEYRCSCGAIHTILLCKFLEKDKLSCVSCRENAEKTQWHKLFFEMKRKGQYRGHKNNRHKVSYDFESESEEFKEKYFEHNLRPEEFNSIKKYIYSINGVCVENKQYNLVVASSCKNGCKYKQSISLDNEIIPLKDIYLRCPLCGKIFHITRHLKERYLLHNFDCVDCYLSNQTFATKKYREGLTYQGHQELSFIKRCDENNIDITNGITVKYFFKDKIRKYKIDFTLPSLKFLIEVKDNHIWHRKQVESGQWALKENAARKYAEENGYQYFLLFPSDMDDFFETLKR